MAPDDRSRPPISPTHQSHTHHHPTTANAKGWDLLYSFKETYRVPDVSAKSISVAAQRILHDSHYTSRSVFLSVCGWICVNWLGGSFGRSEG